MAKKLQIRRGLKAELDLITLAIGEFGYCHDTKELFIGTSDGNKLVNSQHFGDKNVQANWTQTDNEEDDYIQNKPSIPTVPTISTDIETDFESDTKTVSPKAVYDYIDSVITTALGDDY